MVISVIDRRIKYIWGDIPAEKEPLDNCMVITTGLIEYCDRLGLVGICKWSAD